MENYTCDAGGGRNALDSRGSSDVCGGGGGSIATGSGGCREVAAAWSSISACDPALAAVLKAVKEAAVAL